MPLDLVAIKQILRLAGITDLAVRFDEHKRQIEATFTMAGQKRTELVKFSDIEDMFTEGPSQNSDFAIGSFPVPAGPPAEETPIKSI